MAIDQWRSYLQPAEFIIKMDQKFLIHLDDQRVMRPWQQKALTKLLGLNYKILYKKGTENRVADALSRIQHNPPVQVSALSLAQPTWLTEIQSTYLQDEISTKLLSELSLTSHVGHHTLMG